MKIELLLAKAELRTVRDMALTIVEENHPEIYEEYEERFEVAYKLNIEDELNGNTFKTFFDEFEAEDYVRQYLRDNGLSLD